MPPDFVQHKEPKIRVDDLMPVEWPDDPSLEWCPPGHGDLYTALLTSGMLDALLDRGYRYAFVSNSDNLGAVLEPRILAWIAREEIPFAMEVTAAHGGRPQGRPHRAPCRDGGYVLRETAQTPEEDLEALQDITRHRYVNTNNLWVDLRALREVLERARRRARAAADRQPQDGRSRATSRRRRCSSSRPRWAPRSACSTARGRWPCRAGGSRRSRRPRTCWRCARTPTCSLDDARVELAPERDGTPPVVDLDDEYYKLLRDFDARFPDGAPSLVRCERLAVEGDVTFGRGRRGPRGRDRQRAAADRGRDRPRGLT